MIRFLLISMLILLTAACDDDRTYTDSEQNDDDVQTDSDTADDDLSFNLTPVTVESAEKASRDIISCGEMIIVCGESAGKGYITAYRNGSQVWGNSPDTYHIQSYNSLACFNGETIYAAGDRYQTAEAPLTAFIQSLGMDGNVKWEKTLDNGKSVSFYALATDSEGSVFAGGRVDGPLGEITGYGEKDGFVTKFDKNGEQSFTTMIGTTVFDTVQALEIGSDGFILTAGHSAGNIETGEEINSSESGMQGFVVKLKPDGAVHWKKMYNADMFWDITVLLPGSFYIAGNVTGDNVSKAVVFQAGLDGTVKSTYKLPAEKNVKATGISHDGKKNLYITGYIEGNFSTGGKIPPFEGSIAAGSNVFIGIIGISSGELLYSGIFGGDLHDVNPKVAVDSSLTPHILYYSLENLTDSSGTAAMIRLERK